MKLQCVYLGLLYTNRQGLSVFFFCNIEFLNCFLGSKSSDAICVASVAKQIQVILKNVIIMCQPKMKAMVFHHMNNAFLMKPFHFSSLKTGA